MPERPAPARGNRVTHADLVRLAHLADVDHGGLVIDFGTQSRFKYTSGNWNSGWLSDGTRGEETFSRFGRMGRIYFDVREPGPLALDLKVRNVGGGPFLSFMNGETLREPTIEGDGFQEITIQVPAEHVRTGENYLLLRGTETSSVDDEDVSFEVASLHIRRGGGERTGESPSASVVRAREGAPAVVIEDGTELSWVVEVPAGEDVRLDLEHTGSGTLAVSATPEGGETSSLGELSASERFASEGLSLAQVSDNLVRLELRASGGDVALRTLRVTTPRPQLVAAADIRNVIVLTVDTLRASKLRPYNRRSRVRTPALNAFAEQSMLFERAQSSENWTKPAVASILTGLFPATHGAKNDASRLPHNVTTLGEAFQGADFETASFLANGYVSRAFGFDQGWDHYTNYIRERKNTNASNVFGEAADWIEEHKDERFFVYIQTIDPHVPYDPPDDFLRMYDARTDYDGQVQNRRTHLLLEDAKRRPPRVTFSESDVQRLEALHDGEISYHDRHFGAFLEKLEEWDLDENTLVILTSDHGEEFNEHGSWGHGHSIFQELLHVPLIVRWPGVTEAGSRVPQVVSTMDIAPTVLEAAGVNVPNEMEARSLVPFLRGGQTEGPWIAFSDFQENRRVARARNWKLVLRSSLTYVLFDLSRDPNEQNEVEPRRHPVAMRYLRQLSGQVLGVENRAGWLTGGSEGRVAHETTEMTLELCQQLVALGYMDCLSQFPNAI